MILEDWRTMACKTIRAGGPILSNLSRICRMHPLRLDNGLLLRTADSRGDPFRRQNCADAGYSVKNAAENASRSLY